MKVKYDATIEVELSADPGEEIDNLSEHLLQTLNERLGQMEGDEVEEPNIKISSASIVQLEAIE